MKSSELPEDFVSHIAADIEYNRNESFSFEHEDAINDKTEIKLIVPVITIKDSTFAVRGDISIIGGHPKTGKTSVCAFLLATALMKDVPSDFDSLGIRVLYCEGRQVIYVDTEQPQAYTDKLRKQVLSLLGVKDQPKNLGIVNLRKYSATEKQKKVEELFAKYPKAHLWIIDGVADLILDPNDTKESFKIIEMFMMLSEKCNTTIVLHIHENPGTAGKLRGNLGSEAERKCGGAISLKKLKDQKGVHAIEPKLIRGTADFETIYFRFDPALGRPVSLDATQSSELRKTVDKEEIKRNTLISYARKTLLTGRKTYSELVTAIEQVSLQVEGKMIGKRTAQSRIAGLIQREIVTQNDTFYAIAEKYITQP